MSIVDTKRSLTLQAALHRTAAHRQPGKGTPAVLAVFADCRIPRCMDEDERDVHAERALWEPWGGWLQGLSVGRDREREAAV